MQPKSWDVQVKTLEPGTHAYSFWEGVPTEGKIAFGKLFAGCTTMKVRHLKFQHITVS